MIENFWHNKYPKGTPAEIDPSQYRNVQDVLKQCCTAYASKPAFSNLGSTISWGDVYRLSGQFAAFLQHKTDLQPGDRIAIQLPNLLQYPVVMFGALRAGLIVVNTNPLYTAREMEHQFKDSGAKALVCLANMANLVEEVLPHTEIRHLLITEVGDFLPPIKRVLVNTVVRYVKRMVPQYNLPQALPLNKALALGKGLSVQEADPASDDIAMLQYTGGTTGVAKGAMLTHRNLVANMLQTKGIVEAELDESICIVAPLPLYHIYSFTVHCMVMMLAGGHNVLITNPRDLKATIKEISLHPFNAFVGLNTLFIALANNESFRKLDFSKLKFTISGGMALQESVALRWEEVTGKKIAEGYGLTEASPVITVNPPSNIHLGCIGIPVPSTLCKTIDEQGNDLPLGEAGELCAKGPQVMKGYWQLPEATAEVITADGWLKTGDIAVIQDDGFIRVVDRKKDMILVSGFNVYPNELEEVLMGLPGVMKCAAIGVPDQKSGEAIKVFVVRQQGSELTEKEVLGFMHDNVTGYKRPRFVEFRDTLPESNVGKILRRELRDEELQRLKKSA